MKKFFLHTRVYIFRGLLAIIPIVLSFIALKLLYILIDKRVIAFIEPFAPVRHIPGLGILLVLVCLYIIGLIVSNVIGRQLFRFIERVSERIPFVKAIYQIGKQLSDSLSVTEGKNAFQKALLIDVNHSGIWTIAFVTGTIRDKDSGEELLKMFVPKVPNPTTGFVFIVKPSQTRDPGWSVEEALKMVVSAGIIAPPSLSSKNTNP